MKKTLLAMTCVYCTIFLQAQNLPFKMEELNAPQFADAIEKSKQTVILPIGVFEKHGPHLPLGTDLITAREIACRAAEKEYTVVFPWYYFSQINEARHQPGTIAYSPKLIWDVLQETLDELSRNGFKKIIIFNGHGGNNAFLEYFGMAQLSEKRDYALYWFRPEYDRDVLKQAEALTQHDPYDQHAGNRETSVMKAIVPNLINTDEAGTQSGIDLERMRHLPHVYSGIWWYSSYPNHYSGDGTKANAEAGELILNNVVDQFVETIRNIKNDSSVPKLQEEFFNKTEKPLETEQ
ncbi:MAG: creatininase family protein [Fermentimonas sp.]|jgi:creatinine amidohydrolase